MHIECFFLAGFWWWRMVAGNRRILATSEGHGGKRGKARCLETARAAGKRCGLAVRMR